MNYLLRILILLVVLTGISCSGDNAPECFKNMGAEVTYTLPADPFTSIHISAGIELIIVQGDTQSIQVSTGENIKEYISATVTNGELRLTNANNCNWVRDYKSTTITVTTPNLDKIYTASQFDVKSAGVLAFPNLNIQSGLQSETASGSVILNVDCDNLTIEDNQNLYCVINGSVENLSVNFYAGDARFDGHGLTAQKVAVFHRSSNDIIVGAQQQVTGTIYSTGNLVLLNHPPVVEVNSVYSGQVVYGL